MCSLVIVLLYVTMLISFACPTIDLIENATWKISTHLRQTYYTYIEKIGDSSSFFAFPTNSWPAFKVHFMGAGSINVSPSTTNLGLETNVNFTVTSNKISTVRDGETISIGSVQLWHLSSFNVTFDGPGCVGICEFGSTSNCYEICPYSGYISPGSSCNNYTCYPCDCNCFTCFGPFRGMCSSCLPGLFLDVVNLCATDCGQDYYPDPNDNTCKRCAWGCRTCTGPSYNDCGLCHWDYYLQPNSTTCSLTCPDGFGYGKDNMCAPCSSSCATCYSALNTSCISCKANYFLQAPYNVCVATCDDGYYANISTQTCEPCDLGCRICRAAGTNNCTSCNSSAGYYLYPNSTVCSQTCPSGYFGLLGACLSCPAECQTCSNFTTCTSCYLPNFLQSIGRCTQDCPNGYYANAITYVCDPCDLACSTCFGPSNTECFQCATGYHSEPSSQSTCNSSCPARYFRYPASDLCLACYFSCSSCYGTTRFDCITCNSGLYLQPSSNECLTSCPTGYYKNTTLKKCIACHSACKTCFGGDFTQCSSCQSGYFLQGDSTTCLNTCPSAGYWADTSKNVCSPCNSACSRCTGSGNNQCSACSPKYYLQPNNSKTCLNTCGNGYWADSTINVCSSCAATCKFCTGPSTLDCASCGVGFYWNLLLQKCVTSCPGGYYPDNAKRLCSLCDRSCRTCFGPSNDGCSSCQAGFFLQPSSATCLPSCPDAAGYWANPSTNECLPCSKDCETCNNLGSDSCLSCKKGSYLIEASGTCVASCPEEGYYPNSVPNTCSACDKACVSCFGPTNTECQTCQSGFYLQASPDNSTCLNSCPTEDYCPDEVTKSCKLCSPFRKWSIWTAIAYVIWFLLTLLVVKTTNKNYCLINGLKRRQESYDIKPHFTYKLVMNWLATHPLLMIYLYKDNTIAKSGRALLFLIRMLVLFDIAAIFHLPEVISLFFFFMTLTVS